MGNVLEEKIAVLILAAGSIKNKYRNYSFVYNSPALVPIASRSSLSFIISFYEKINSKIYIAINANEEELFKNELLYYNNICLLPIEDSEGVCDTISQVLPKVLEEEVIINLGTTIPVEMPLPNSLLVDLNETTNAGYSGINFKSGQIKFITKSNANSNSFYAFTGIIRQSKSNLIYGLNSIQNKTDLLELALCINNKNPLFVQKTEWIDTGHEINYADARKKLISSRSFNTISVNNHTGILTKKSTNTTKLIQEITFVSMLPTELKIAYPRILSSDSIAGTVEMEYYGYPNLSEYQLYRSIDNFQWRRVFEGLHFQLSAMKRFSFSIGPNAFHDFYFRKTIDRVDSFLASLPQNDILNTTKSFTINGEQFSNFHSLSQQIDQRICGIYNEADFCVMHGDFCFNNILFDTVSETTKLIDPRGSFGENCIGIYGDHKYDVAKLLHSTLGLYDYIVNNLFSLEQDGNSFNYSFPLRANQNIIQELSDELIGKLAVKKEDILFIVGLLFLSMCPLHNDNPQRQKLMYLHGLTFVNKYL